MRQTIDQPGRCFPMPQVTEEGFLQPHQRDALCLPCPIRMQCLRVGLTSPNARGTYGGVDIGLINRSRRERQWLAKRLGVDDLSKV